ncbi:sensor histidine kinase [Sphingomicrobium sediminis]|uniref:histidine kinase n=1 Tax=Sphingomicrobium sediminis TaxID=2950949 RepID=A0A9X2EFH3_9SPHN|nr:ATP-binding protein [Sphingomicrobium sediminis]MCM8556983.1 ATP-binding protein [Sphingomicrobium sediminis]
MTSRSKRRLVMPFREKGAPAFWRFWMLVHRILAVNILPILLFTVGVIWLDAYRNQLRDERVARLADNAIAAAEASVRVDADEQGQLLAALGRAEGVRFRLYGADGIPLADSWNAGPVTYELRDPDLLPWHLKAARIIDRGFNGLVGAPSLEPFAEPEVDRAVAWPEISAALQGERIQTRVREAPESTPVFSAAVPLGDGSALLATINDRDYTDMVRRERSSLAIMMAGALLLSVLLSLFLARTIARPLRRIALAAQRVRAGRSREVRVPRLPNRYDEIGALARAVGDMSQALADRIDKIEAFAADVSHELKNPLASLRSAVDSLERIDDPELKNQLLDVVRQDITRLDRLISDISEAARTDAQLTRTPFEPIDLSSLIGNLVDDWRERRETGNAYLEVNDRTNGRAIVQGEPIRLARAIDNLLDNAISFSPPESTVRLTLSRDEDLIYIQVVDEGPGVPEEQRDAIFHRFHSHRPDTSEFGRHSGLGLAIARAIIEGHEGTISVCDRKDGKEGACFMLTLPAEASL